MINLELENKLLDLEKEFNYNPSIYPRIEKWALENKLDEDDLETMLIKLDYLLASLYKYKKSLVIKDQRGVENKVVEVLEKHLEISVSEPEVIINF